MGEEGGQREKENETWKKSVQYLLIFPFGEETTL